MATPRGFHRVAEHVRQLQKDVGLARKRAVATLVRRLNTATVRKISNDVLNLPQNKVRPSIKTYSGNAGDGDFVAVSASRTRLPLTDYKARASAKNGVTVTTWKDAGPQTLPHAFVRKDGKPGVWQRIPSTLTRSGLVDRLAIVQRKGPDIHRVFLPEGTRHAHGNVAEVLAKEGHDVLAAEVERLARRKGG